MVSSHLEREENTFRELEWFGGSEARTRQIFLSFDISQKCLPSSGENRKAIHDKGRRIFTHNPVFCQHWPHLFVLDVFSWSWCLLNMCSIFLVHLGASIGQVTGFEAWNISVSLEVNAYK